ncbi:hypothetical protein ME3_01323, partial [Bartonella melophagi K-2C]
MQCARYAFGLSGIYDEDEAERINETRINETNHSLKNERVSDETLAQIKELIKQTKTEEAKVLSFAQVTKLTEMSHETGQIVLEHLKKRQRSQQHLQKIPNIQPFPIQEPLYTSIQGV